MFDRLGEVEKAIYHYKHAGQEADQFDIAKAKSVQAHLNKCTEAKKHRDWNTLIKETESAAAAGADSALQVYQSNLSMQSCNYIYNGFDEIR